MRIRMAVKVTQTDPADEWFEYFDHHFFTWEAAGIEASAQVRALNDNEEGWLYTLVGLELLTGKES